MYALRSLIRLCVNAEPVTYITDLYVLKANDRVVSAIINILGLTWVVDVDSDWQKIVISNI